MKIEQQKLINGSTLAPSLKNAYEDSYRKGIAAFNAGQYDSAYSLFQQWLSCLEGEKAAGREFYLQSWRIMATLAQLKGDDQAAFSYLAQLLFADKQDIKALAQFYKQVKAKDTVEKIEIFNLFYKGRDDIRFIYKFLYDKNDLAALFYRRVLQEEFQEAQLENLPRDYYINAQFEALQRENINLLQADYLLLSALGDVPDASIFPPLYLNLAQGQKYEQREIYDKINNIKRMLFI